MKTTRQEFVKKTGLLALQVTLAVLATGQAVRAQEDATPQELTAPTQKIEAGVGGVSKDSNKAGEYDGLQKKGAHVIGNFDLRGGGTYDSNDATRWRLQGTDLGLETRSLKSEYGEQGKFRFFLDYDELTHNLSDSYMTPFLGAGGTRLTLPGTWQAPAFQTGAAMSSTNGYPAPTVSMLGLGATSVNSPLVTNARYFCRGTTNGCAANPAFGGAFTTGYQTGNAAATAANTALYNQNLADLNSFHGVNLSTKREKYGAGAALIVSSQWDASFKMEREDKNGLREQGVVNADGGPSGTYTRENAAIIPRVIDYTTDQINAALNFKGEKSFFTVAYYGSIFTNHAKSMTIDNPTAVGTYNGVAGTAYGPSTATISEEPDSTFNQLRLTGNYDLSSKTKIVADASYSRNAQNDQFILDPAMFGTPSGALSPALNNGTVVPENSANAAIINKTFDLKLTTKPLRDLKLAAAYKYDDRDNQTPVNNYTWYDAGAKNFALTTSGANANNSPLYGATIPGVPAGTPLYGGVNTLANRPYSKRVNKLDFDADYALTRAQSIKAGIDYTSIDRHCNGTWIDCSFADNSRETTGTLEYRFHAAESLSGRLAGDYGFRKVDYNANAWMSLDPGLQASNIPGLVAAGGGAYSGSVLGFLNANGLTAQGLPIAANAPSPFTGNTLSTYQALFGKGNGGLSNGFYASHNTTSNWSGLDVYNMANRDHSRLRGMLDWQANEAMSFQLGADYRHDKYPDSTYGLESTDNLALNLDGDYAASDDLSLSAYVNFENQLSKSAGDSVNNGSLGAVAATATGPAYVGGAPGVVGGAARNSAVVGGCQDSSTVTGIANPTAYQIYNNAAKIDPCNGWQAEMRDKTDTVGLALTKKRLFTPKLTLRGDLSYSRSVTSNSMTGGFYYANPAAAYVSGVPAVYYINAAALPDVTVASIRVRLTGDYKVTKTGTVRVSYTYLDMHTDDYQYATNQPSGTSAGVMPSFESNPSYAVHIVGVSYLYLFQ
jgi:hypothetical protein